MNTQQSTELWGFAYLDNGKRVEIISHSAEDGQRQIHEHAVRMSQRDRAAAVCVSAQSGMSTAATATHRQAVDSE